MPIYEYRCKKGHEFEVIQRMSDDPVTECEECGAPVERIFNPVAVHFKGSGFYTTDYARSSKGGQGSGKESDSGSSKSESKSEKKKESKKSGKGSTSSGGGKAKTS
jgi:putative FmdB family regulatory protein